MLSRVQSINQLYILDKMPVEKLNVSEVALKEVNRLEEISINHNPSTWDKKANGIIKVCFFNARSIKNKFQNIKYDYNLNKADCLMLSETWVGEDDCLDIYKLDGFKTNFLFGNRGRGSVVFYKEPFVKPWCKQGKNHEITKINSNENAIHIY